MFAATCCALPPFATSTSSGFITPGLIAAAAKPVAAGNRGSGAGEVLELSFVGVQARAQTGERGNDDQTDRGDCDRPAEHEARPAPPGAVFRMAAIGEPGRERIRREKTAHTERPAAVACL